MVATHYPPMAKSPATTITAGINDVVATIPIAECANLPAAPNLATLGTGDDAEVVLYAAKSAASGAGNLTSCTRGVVGTAKAWDSGTYIARLLTSYDISTLQTDVASKSPTADPTFTGVPAAPTAAQDVNTTQLATTAFVIAQQTRDNFIINGNFDIWQRGTSFTSATVPINSDDTYLTDNWVLLSDGNNIVNVTRSAVNVPAGSVFTLLATVVTANKKFGFITFLEQKDAVKLAGKNVSLSFKACTTAGKVINNIRAAVISWASTGDVITSDVVNAWGNSGTNPTVVANWTLENVAANLLLTNAMATYKIENIAVDTASLANVAVFIWVDDTDCAAGDLLYLSQVKLEVNPVATSYQPPMILDELLKCQRYMVKFNPLGNTYPAIAIGQCRSTTLARCIATLPVDMLAVPASTQKGNLAVTQASATVQAVTNLALVAAMCTPRQIWWEATVAANLVAGNATVLEGNNDVTADIWLEAVL